MTRPLFAIAKEIATEWKTPTPQAKAYLKGMYYLLGMNDRAADLDAMTTVRMFLLYSKDWIGATADRIKAELQAMRAAKAPTNEELLESQPIKPCALTITHCELCEASLGSPAKFIDAHTHWKKPARMCMHCNYFLSPGIDLGDGALYFCLSDGQWCHLHGAPKLVAASLPAVPNVTASNRQQQPKLRQRLKYLGRKVVRKCFSIARRWMGRPA